MIDRLPRTPTALRSDLFTEAKTSGSNAIAQTTTAIYFASRYPNDFGGLMYEYRSAALGELVPPREPDASPTPAPRARHALRSRRGGSPRRARRLGRERGAAARGAARGSSQRFYFASRIR